MRQVTHALLTRPPLSHSSVRKLQVASFDLHVLGTPPAFILSQDQTLMLKFIPVQNLAWLVLNRSTVVLGFVLNILIHGHKPKGHFIRIFRVLHTVQFSRFFAVLRQPDYYNIAFSVCQQVFSTFLFSFFKKLF